MPTDILQEVGSYAGLAAVIGLAVLSALYFSQARDVKRLREWAGRAPERSAEDVAQTAAAPATSGAVVAQPQPKKPAAAPAPVGAGAQPGQAKPSAPKPAGVPVPAQAAAAGAAPATAKAAGGPEGSAPAAATPAGEAKQAAAGEGPPAPGEQAEAGATAAATTDTDESAAAKPGEEPAVAASAAGQGARDGESDQLEGDEAAESQGAVAAQGAQSAAARRQEGAAAPGDTEDHEALVPPQAAPVPQAAAAGTQTPEGLRPGGRAGTQAPPRPRPATGARPTPPPPASRAPSVPGRAGSRPPARPGPARAAQTAIIPPPSRAPWYSRLAASPRYLVLVIAGLLIVGGGALFGLSQLGEDDGGTGSRGAGGAPAEQADDDGGGQAARQPIAPAEVTVAVLNGTTVPGLAAQIGDRIETFGFDLGTVTNSTDQQRAESVVLFAPGHQREAVAVGRRLSIDQRERVDAESQGLAGDATVVVIAGIDQTQ